MSLYEILEIMVTSMV